MPRCASSSWCVPASRSSPLCSTRMRSMSWIVDSRCAIAIVVRPRISTLQRVADQELGLGVDARRRLVEDEHAGIERQRARERQQLLLPDRQRRAALGHRRRRARAAGGRRTSPHAPPRARVAPSSSVIASWPSRTLPAIVPENRCTSCSTRPNCARRSREVQLADVHAVDRDAPLLHVVEAQQQADDRRLARAGRADDRHALPGLDLERDVPQHRLALDVGEGDVLERDRARRPRRRRRAAAAGPLAT